MKIIQFVNVDAKDGRPENVRLARHGAVPPVTIEQILKREAIDNAYPLMVGTTSDDVEGVAGILHVLNEDEVGVLTAELKGQAKDRATQARWEFETGGITLPDGIKVATGLDDQNRISSVITHAENAGIENVDFKSDSGWINISVADLSQVAVAVSLHVQSSFSMERQCHEEIDALTNISEIANYIPIFNRD